MTASSRFITLFIFATYMGSNEGHKNLIGHTSRSETLWRKPKTKNMHLSPNFITRRESDFSVLLALHGGATESDSSASDLQSNEEQQPYNALEKKSQSTSQQPQSLSCAHWMSTADCLHDLQVSEIAGLSNKEVEARLKLYGKNELTRANEKSLLSLIFEQFEDKLVQILLAVALLSAVLAAFEKVIIMLPF